MRVRWPLLEASQLPIREGTDSRLQITAASLTNCKACQSNPPILGDSIRFFESYDSYGYDTRPKPPMSVSCNGPAQHLRELRNQATVTWP